MTQSRKIFDTQLARSRRIKALKSPKYPDFLDKIIAQELVSRLELIERTFKTCLIAGPASPVFIDTIKASPKLSNVITQTDIEFSTDWLPFGDDSLDCIIAPTGLEMSNDLVGTLIQFNKALRPDGLFLGAMFSSATLQELRHVWLNVEIDKKDGATPRVIPFSDVRQTGGLLQRAGFGLPVSDMDSFIVRYDGALALMTELKTMGLANPLCDRSHYFCSKNILKKVEETYAALFSDPDERIRATFEINYLTAWAPHENQQKPLKPGSAKQRLADALKP